MEEAKQMKIDEQIDSFFEPIANKMSEIVFYSVNIGGTDVKLILLWLMACGIFFTVYLGFINIRYFCYSIRLVSGRADGPESQSDDDGQISRFQALMTSLSGTVGLGNISGVALAISAGGPGAMLWMIVLGFFGMSSKFAEVMLGVKYRHHPDPEHPDTISGGPMYYLKAAFENRNIPFIGTALAMLFALCCMLGAIGGGNMYQANQAYQQVKIATGGDASIIADTGWVFGLGLAVLVGLVIIGGIKSIANVASKLVPAMGILYLGAGLIVIGINFQQIPTAIITVFTEAFSPQAAYGGFIGVLFVGAQRAFFSNEAGLGSASIVHATAKTNSPVSQGFVGMLGPFIDTVIICSITAMVIVITDSYKVTGEIEGIALTSRAFESTLPGFQYILTLTVFLFAFSTMITWSYYGSKGMSFLCGEKEWPNTAFKLLFCLCIIIGCSSKLDNIIAFTDAAILSLAIPNIIGLYMLAPEIRRDVKEYTQALKKSE
ncbi:MAG: alanine:cation symporter family protein [Alphaproteobacteria bacterium]|nr:alanine:cation symporter family protein [Alphaproteobacteria bacterium]